MKKTLVAIAAVAAVTGAMAEVTITGNIDQAVTTIKGTTAGVEDTSTTGLMAVSTPSWITFAGSEDLGNGLKASFKLENGLGINSTDLLGSNDNWNNVSSNNREAWVGISGDFGNVQLGTQYTPLFFTAAGTDFNGVNNVTGWSPFMVIFGNNAGFNYNNLTYTSPSASGFTLSFQQVYGTSDTETTSNGDGTGWSINYGSGPFTAGYAQNRKTLTEATALVGPGVNGSTLAGTTDGADGDSVNVNVAAVTYDLGMAKLSYLNTTASLLDDSIRIDTFGINVPLGATTVAYTVSSGKTTNDGTSASDDVSFSGQQLGLYYDFSKRTKAYFVYALSKDTTNDNTTTSTAVGIRHSF